MEAIESISTSEKSMLPDISEEQKQQVLQFLQDLEQQRLNDPASYAESMKTLGLLKPNDEFSTGQSIDSTEPVLNVSALTEEILKLRTTNVNEQLHTGGSLNFADGKSLLGKAGIEQKVRLDF